MHYGNAFSMKDTKKKHPNTEVSYFLYIFENTDWLAAIGK